MILINSWCILQYLFDLFYQAFIAIIQLFYFLFCLSIQTFIYLLLLPLVYLIFSSWYLLVVCLCKLYKLFFVMFMVFKISEIECVWNTHLNCNNHILVRIMKAYNSVGDSFSEKDYKYYIVFDDITASEFQYF